MRTKVAIIMVGAPGSGKSTIVSELAGAYEFDVVCPDSIRGELFGDERCQENGRAVFDIAYERFDHALLDRSIEGAVFDSTGASRKTRRKLASIAASHGAVPIALWVDTPLDVCLERNASRDRFVPEDVIERMHGRIASCPPSTDEGFALVASEDDIIEVLADILAF